MSDHNDGVIGKVVSLILIVIVAIAAFILVKVRNVSGNELGVLETWSDGVIQEPLQPKTHVFFPGFTKSVYTYDMGMNVLVYNDLPNHTEKVAHGRDADAYIVQSADQQDMKISFRLQWRRRPEAVVTLHKICRDEVEERVLRTPVLNIVKNQATTRTALEAYSGAGLVKLQNDIIKELHNSEDIKKYVTIEGFVIEHIALEKKYTNEIVERQVAVQEKLKNEAKTAAAAAAADMAKAQAQADYEKTLVEARRDKEKGILAAEQDAQRQVLAAEASAKQVALAAEADAKKVTIQAEAEKNRNVLIALGEREAAENKAKAIEAVGRAEAEAQKLKLLAYSGQGAEMFARIEVSKNMANAFSNIKGYLPEKMSVNLLADQFEKGVNVLVGNGESSFTIKK